MVMRDCEGIMGRMMPHSLLRQGHSRKSDAMLSAKLYHVRGTRSRLMNCIRSEGILSGRR